MKKFLITAVIVFIGCVIEISLLYFSKAYGDLGFKISLRPDSDMF